MTTINHYIRLSRPDDVELIDQLHNTVFGPGRFARTAYRIREQAQERGFTLTAWQGAALAGTAHFTPVTVGKRDGVIMLGPLAVAPHLKGQGFGRWLVEEGVARVTSQGAALVILVGDLAYYARMGFTRIPPGQIRLPGPVAPERLLARELKDHALAEYAGEVSAQFPPQATDLPLRTNALDQIFHTAE